MVAGDVTYITMRVGFERRAGFSAACFVAAALETAGLISRATASRIVKRFLVPVVLDDCGGEWRRAKTQKLIMK